MNLRTDVEARVRLRGVHRISGRAIPCWRDRMPDEWPEWVRNRRSPATILRLTAGAPDDSLEQIFGHTVVEKKAKRAFQVL